MDDYTLKILYKEIDLIQACINRMAHNSFLVKGWIITLFAAVLALLPASFDTKGLCIIGFVITICFWYLDAFFLKTEKLYRWKYEWVICQRKQTDLYTFDLSPYNINMWLKNDNGTFKKSPTILRVMFTKTLCPMYSMLLLGILLFYIHISFKWF
jgi:hypothetical protein